MTIFDTVVKGRGLGKALGYPTANLAHRHRIPSGVWAVEVTFGSQAYAWTPKNSLESSRKRGYVGLLVVGAFRHPDRTLAEEVHILNFHWDLYGKNISLKILKRLRGIVPYTTDAALKNLITQDIAYVHRHYTI